MVNRAPVILAFLAFGQLIPSSAWAQGYFLEDLQYFRPIVADVRTSQNHLRLYRAGGVPFSNSASQGDHTFVDASFGERVSLLGYSFPTSTREPLRIPGVSMFVDGASHLLIDLNTESRDVINADYRIGLGLAVRAPVARFLAFRYQFLHESAHIGDEYTLFASQQPNFRRYNVSFEANELYAAIDHVSELRPGLPPPRISYMRAFVGFRHLNTDRYAGFNGLFEPATVQFVWRVRTSTTSVGKSTSAAIRRLTSVRTQVGGHDYLRSRICSWERISSARIGTIHWNQSGRGASMWSWG